MSFPPLSQTEYTDTCTSCVVEYSLTVRGRSHWMQSSANTVTVFMSSVTMDAQVDVDTHVVWKDPYCADCNKLWQSGYHISLNRSRALNTSRASNISQMSWFTYWSSLTGLHCASWHDMKLSIFWLPYFRLPIWTYRWPLNKHACCLCDVTIS